MIEDPAEPCDADTVACIAERLAHPNAAVARASAKAVVAMARAYVDRQVGFPPGDRIGTSIEDYRMVLRLRLPDYQNERSGIIALDVEGRLIDVIPLCVGNVDQVFTPHALVFRGALSANASGFVAWHSHPSSSAHPSSADLLHLQRLLLLATELQIRLQDYVILSRAGAYFSAAEYGLLDMNTLAEFIRFRDERQQKVCSLRGRYRKWRARIMVLRRLWQETAH